MSNSAFNATSFAGLSAVLVGNGIGRFAYIVIMPILIQAHWFSGVQASYLGVSTLVGYIFGALLGNVLSRFCQIKNLLRWSMLICSISYLACAMHSMPISWFYLWRVLAGVTGAILMVVVPPFVVRQHESAMKTRVSSLIFSGLGLGIVISGTLIPLLIKQSVTLTWLVMGIISLTLTLCSWNHWNKKKDFAPEKSDSSSLVVRPVSLPKTVKITIVLLLIAYSLDAIGYLPHTLFWVDFLVSQLKLSVFAGGFFWAVLGVGAVIGPIIAGSLAEKLGLKKSLVFCFLLKSLGVLLPLVSTYSISLFFSSLLVGAFTPGVIALISAYLLECTGTQLHPRLWMLMTFCFAVSQAVAGYVMTLITAHTHSYFSLFEISTAALIIAALCIAVSASKSPQYFLMSELKSLQGN